MSSVERTHGHIFRGGSKTYYNSSLFFPKDVRTDVFTLYAFVRYADDFVDAIPQRAEGFYAFRDSYRRAAEGHSAGDGIIDPFVRLATRRGFEPEWTEAFLRSMEMDLTKRVYRSLSETLEYIYGSAEVIGLYMMRILELADTARHPAMMQGRAMQYINFVRDIPEDNRLGRTYLPLEDTSLPHLQEAVVWRDPEEFSRFIRAQIGRYREWQRQAQEGYALMPKRVLVPIKTASDMYDWTARVIADDPFVVFRRKVKPMRTRILARVLANALRPYPMKEHRGESLPRST
ncbi:MAG: phytoene/squalene synthase family protein [Spirochaetaceae bacterium]